MEHVLRRGEPETVDRDTGSMSRTLREHVGLVMGEPLVIAEGQHVGLVMGAVSHSRGTACGRS